MRNIKDNVEGEKIKEERIKHIDKYINEPIVKSVLVKETSLEKEVKTFYGLKPYFSVAGRCPHIECHEFEADKRDTSKQGTINSKIIEIVSPFSKYEVDISKLDYNSVRDSFELNNKTTLKQFWEGFSAFGIGFGGGIGAVIYTGSTGDFVKGIPLVFACFAFVPYRLFNGMSANPKDQGGYTEFLQLWDASRKADNFISNSYKSYFIKQNLK